MRAQVGFHTIGSFINFVV